MATNIYSNIDIAGTQDMVRRWSGHGYGFRTEPGSSDTRRNETLQHTGIGCVRSRRSRAATVCLGLLCVLLLAAVIVLCVQIITERDPFHIKSKNYTEEREQLLTKITNLTEEREQLLTINTNLIEQSELWKKWIRKMDGWIYYQFSCYYISSEWRTWNESRQDCLQREADLIIINNKEEHEFVKKTPLFGNVWIGLSDSAEEGTWKWVDNSTLTSGFWGSGEPNNQTGEEDCVVSTSSGWIDCPCHFKYKWICEKSISE